MNSQLTKTFLFIGIGSLLLVKAKGQESNPDKNLNVLGGLVKITTTHEKNKVLPNFTQVKAGQTFEIELFKSDRHSIYFESTDENKVTAEVNNEMLELSLKDNDLKGPVKVKVYFKELKSLQLSGAASASNEDTLEALQFSISTSGASKTHLKLKNEILKIDAEGASDVTVSGKCTSANYKLSGASKLKAFDLIAQKVTIETTGASNAKLNVTEYFSASAEGASHVSFTGSPEYKNIHINGVATVKDKADGGEFNNDLIMGTENNGDTTKLKIGKRKFLIIEDGKDKEESTKSDSSKRRRMKSVWGGFELGVNGMVTPEMNFTFSNNYKYLNTKMGESWFFGLNLPELDGHIIKNKLAVTTGLGFQWNNIHFEGNDFLTPNADSLSSTNAGAKLSLNKLYTFDITAPLLIKIAPGSKKRSRAGFHIAAGAILHYVATARVTTETSANGYFQHTELEDQFNINPFRVDATVRVGYDRIKLFANYSLTPYFNSSKAPDVRMFAAGLTLIGF